jgi:hypothetical protein
LRDYLNDRDACDAAILGGRILNRAFIHYRKRARRGVRRVGGAERHAVLPAAVFAAIMEEVARRQAAASNQGEAK